MYDFLIEIHKILCTHFASKLNYETNVFKRAASRRKLDFK